MGAYPASNAFVSGRFNVWVPGQAQYLSFDTVSEAQAEVHKQTSGLIINPAGQLDPKLQAWAGWTGFSSKLPGFTPVVLAPPVAPGAATVASERAGAAPVIPVVAAVPKATAQPKAGELNVFIPAPYFPSAGISNAARALDGGAFFAFSTLLGAQAFVAAKGVGLVMDGAGRLDPAAQPWKFWETYVPDAENVRLANAPAPGKFTLWFPKEQLLAMGVPRPGRFKQGAYLSFDSEADAVASAKRRQFGMVLTPAFGFAATQPWAEFNAHVQEVPELIGRMKPAAVPGKVNVWIPQQYAGLDAKAFPNGAFMPFDSLAEAQAEVKVRDVGVVLDAKGEVDATQPWGGTPSVSAQLLNTKLTAAPAAGQVNVWFPREWLGSLGLSDTTAFDQGGAWLAFKSEAEAQAHVTTRTFGVIYDTKGAVSATQTWAQAPAFVARALNPQLTATRTDGKYSVWFPGQYLSSIGVTDAKPFPAGAFLSFATQAEAQAHAKARDAGIVLTPAGDVDATQPWGQADQFKVQLSNARLTEKPTPGAFNVWFPGGVATWLGLSDTSNVGKGGAYLAFKTETEAQAEATARTFGVVLDPKGDLAATQPWSYASQYVGQRLNNQLKAQPIAGKFNLWIPSGFMSSAGVNDATAFPNGGFLAFDSAADAQAHEKLRGFGVVLDGAGNVDATQPWDQVDTYKLQLGNLKLVAQRPAGSFSVWFPVQQLGMLGLSDTTKFPAGAYLPFSTAADAQAAVKARTAGVVLDAAGNVDPTQPWDQAAANAVQLQNGRLTSTRTDGQYSVWFPAEMLWSLGLGDISKVAQGAWVAFPTEAEALAHAKARGFGVVLDPKGDADATQPWDQSSSYTARLLNPKLTKSRESGKYSVWFPPSYLPSIGVTDAAKFAEGAYLKFDSRDAALAHIRQRGNFGVLVDEKGQTEAQQPWPQALELALLNGALIPPLASGWVSGPWPVEPAMSATLGAPTAGSVAIQSVTATKSGVDIIANVATVKPPDTFHFFIGAQINGNWMPIFNVPDSVNLAGPDWHQFTLHVDYDAVDAYLKGINPALGIVANMSGAVGIRFTSGHDTGIPGWSQNQGTEKDAVTTLPARAAAVS